MSIANEQMEMRIQNEIDRGKNMPATADEGCCTKNVNLNGINKISKKDVTHSIVSSSLYFLYNA